MVNYINANPGATVVIAIETKKTTGERDDGYSEHLFYTPKIDWIRSPNGSFTGNFPASLTQISIGVYIYTLQIASGIGAIGNYVISASFANPSTGLINTDLFVVNIGLAFGSSSISPA